jgi:dihydroflavonol-4-reductase
MNIVADKPILVTGATGFVAGHIIQMLLEQGNRVRGTVRDLKKNLPMSF